MRTAISATAVAHSSVTARRITLLHLTSHFPSSNISFFPLPCARFAFVVVPYYIVDSNKVHANRMNINKM